MVITDGGQVIRTHVSEIRETGRNTQGVRVIRLKDDEKVVDVEPMAEAEEEETNPGEEGEVSESLDGIGDSSVENTDETADE